MPSPKPTRGRPKGTGLDDRALLQSLIRLIDANPDMKPTTAIKSIGVTDPSAIRRLRDKFHQTQGHGAPRSTAAAASPPVRAMALRTASSPVRSAPIDGHRSSKTAAAPKSASPSLAVEPVPMRSLPKRLVPAGASSIPNWFSLWTELGLQTMAASLNAQWIIYDQVLRSPPVKAAMGSHAALTEFAAAWCATSPDPGKTLH